MFLKKSDGGMVDYDQGECMKVYIHFVGINSLGTSFPWVLLLLQSVKKTYLCEFSKSAILSC